MNELLKKFLKSPLAISLVALNVLLAGGAMLFGLLPTLAALPLLVIVTGGEMVALLNSTSGAKAIVAEQDRKRDERDAEKLAQTSALRKRLALLRVDDPALKASIDRIVLTAGLYLDACAKGGSRDPFVEDAISRAAETINGYLKIADGARVEGLLGSRGSEDADAALRADADLDSSVSRHAGADIARKTRALVDGATRTIEERLALPQGGIEGNHTALDEMESRQELEE